MGVILVAVHRGAAEVLRHYLPDNQAVGVGRSPNNELQINSLMLSRFHCRFTLGRDGQVRVSDARSTSGTWLNDERVGALEIETAPAITEHDAVRIGDWILSFERELTIRSTRTDEERAFLSHIADNPTDEAMRHVYADWLEDQGDRQHEVELLANDRRPSTTDSARRSDLAARIEDGAWKCIMLRHAKVEGCDRPNCSTTWDEAKRVPPHIQFRECQTCTKRIFYAASEEEARAWRTNNVRVVTDR